LTQPATRIRLLDGNAATSERAVPLGGFEQDAEVGCLDIGEQVALYADGPEEVPVANFSWP
jgi:hypothetical protein